MIEAVAGAASRPTREESRAPAAAGIRIKAFAFDYLVIAAYLALLVGVGLFMTFGPSAAEWGAFMSDPVRADAFSFLVLVLPVILYFALSEGSEARATWGKRRAGIEVVGPGGGRFGLGRSLLRSSLKFLPWQMAHTAMLHIPGVPMSPGEAPVWSLPLLVVSWSLVALYLLGLTRIGGRRTLYDRAAGTTVVRAPADEDGLI